MKKKAEVFYFKQFAVRHDRCTMKVGTDGVLLGAWVGVENAKDILDIGTGSGVIALMVAQRTTSVAKIDAIEIEPEDAQQAEENISNSPWPDKVKVSCTSIQNFQPGKQYDIIVSNPPYFINSFRPPEKKRHHARHTTRLSYEELLIAAQQLLKPLGKFNVILPYTEGIQFISSALFYDLHCTRKWSFRSRESKPIERWLLEFSFQSIPVDEGEVILYEKGEQWSEVYKNLTREFYLWSGVSN